MKLNDDHLWLFSLTAMCLKNTAIYTGYVYMFVYMYVQARFSVLGDEIT